MRLALSYIRSFFPRPLPVGLTAFHTWADNIIALSGDFADHDSMKWAIASNLIHLGAQKAYVSDQYFIRSLRKAAANQVASQVFTDVKLKQEAAKAAALNPPVEATTPSPENVAPDVQNTPA